MTGEAPRVSVVVPAYNEGEHIIPVLDRIFESVRLQCEVLVVVDSADDNTVPVVSEYAEQGTAASLHRQHLRPRARPTRSGTASPRPPRRSPS